MPNGSHAIFPNLSPYKTDQILQWDGCRATSIVYIWTLHFSTPQQGSSPEDGRHHATTLENDKVSRRGAEEIGVFFGLKVTGISCSPIFQCILGPFLDQAFGFFSRLGLLMAVVKLLLESPMEQHKQFLAP